MADTSLEYERYFQKLFSLQNSKILLIQLECDQASVELLNIPNYQTATILAYVLTDKCYNWATPSSFQYLVLFFEIGSVLPLKYHSVIFTFWYTQSN